MKKIFFLLILFLGFITSFAQNTDVRANRIIANQSVLTNRIRALQINEPDFGIVVVNDPQYMTLNFPGALKDMFTGIIDSAIQYNLKAVIGGGDLTQNATLAEWQRIDSNYDRLDAANIPYITVPGNHDYNSASPFGRNTGDYNTWFGDARHSGHSYYGGSYGGKAENNWIFFNVGTQKFAVIGLEFFPPDSVLTWASGIADSLDQADPNRQIWVTTHGYQTSFGELANDTTVAGPASYGLGDNNAEEMWTKFIRRHKNIKMVLNGHFRRTAAIEGPSIMRMTDVGTNGNIIHQIMVNYQQDTTGGQGFYMYMKFRPSVNKIDITWFSPYRNRFENRYAAYSIDYPGLQIENSVGIGGELHVNGDVMVDSAFKIKKIPNFRVPFTKVNGEISYDDRLKYRHDSVKLVTPRIDVREGDFYLAKQSGAVDFGIGQRNPLRAQLFLKSSGDNASDIFFGRNINPGFTAGVQDSNYYWCWSARASNQSHFFNLYECPGLTNKHLGSPLAFFGARITVRPAYQGGGLSINNWVTQVATNPFVNSTLSVWGTSYFNDTTRIPNGGLLVANTGTTNMSESAVGEFVSTTRGFLVPRMNTAQQDAIVSPANALLIYNTDSSAFRFWNGSAWVTIGSGSGGGVTDHGVLTGLSDDDHSQYPLSIGRSGGQTIIGGTATTDDLTLQSTSGVGTTGANIFLKVGDNGATTAMTIFNTGNVLHGTTLSTSSATPLNVSFGGTYGLSTVGSSANLKWKLYDDGTAANDYGIGMTAGLMEIRAGTGGAVGIFTNNGTEALRAISSGNVGIGGTPSHLFSVGSSSNFGVNSSGKIVEYNNAAPMNGQLLFGHTANGTFEAGTLTAGTGISVTNSAGGATIAVNSGFVTSNFRTPTATNDANVDASTPQEEQWQRIGDIVNVWGTIQIDATVANTSTQLFLDFPVASDISAQTMVSGGKITEQTTSGVATTGYIVGSIANDNAILNLRPSGTGNLTYSYSYSYRIVVP